MTRKSGYGRGEEQAAAINQPRRSHGSLSVPRPPGAASSDGRANLTRLKPAAGIFRDLPVGRSQVTRTAVLPAKVSPGRNGKDAVLPRLGSARQFPSCKRTESRDKE